MEKADALISEIQTQVAAVTRATTVALLARRILAEALMEICDLDDESQMRAVARDALIRAFASGQKES